MKRCPQCGADCWTVDENAPYCDSCGNLEAPSDDGEPITREWWEQSFPTRSGFFLRTTEITDRLELSLDPDGVWLTLRDMDNYGCVELPHIKTRGQLRQLLALLGYQEKEGVR